MRRRKGLKNRDTAHLGGGAGGNGIGEYYKGGPTNNENSEAAPMYSSYMGELPAEVKRTELDSTPRLETKTHEMQG